MPIQQPELPTRPWEKIGSDIFEYKGKRYLMIVDYYSRFIIVKYLPDIRAETVSNAFIEVLTEYGLPSTIMADCGTQYTSELFRQKCKDSGIELVFSSPYHHQSNSIAERSIGIVKSLWKKEGEDGKSKSTALWIHRITPIDSNTPSPYELLFGRKPRSLLPCCNKATASQHPDTDKHQEANRARQTKQAEQYNRKASRDLRPLQPGEHVDVFNTISRTWEPATVVRRERDRSYVIRRNSREYFRTREHIRPRQHSIMSDVLPMAQPVPLLPPAPPPQSIRKDLLTNDDQPPALPPVRDPPPVTSTKPAPPTKPKQTGTTQPIATRVGRVVKKPARYSDFVPS
jgi:transposase InsO family protein